VDIDYKTVYQAGPTDVLDILTNTNFLRDYALSSEPTPMRQT
jgi:hypothetical protein